MADSPLTLLFADLNERIMTEVLADAPSLQIKTGALAQSEADSPPRIVLFPLREQWKPADRATGAKEHMILLRHVTCCAHIWGEDMEQVDSLLIPAFARACRAGKVTSVIDTDGRWITQQTPAHGSAGQLYEQLFTVKIPVVSTRQTVSGVGLKLTGKGENLQGDASIVVPQH